MFQRLTKGQFCPICNKKDNCSKILKDETGEHIGMICARVGSDHMAKDGRYTHFFNEETTSKIPLQNKTLDRISTLSAFEISQVYTALLDLLKLSKADKKHLLNRGLTEKQIFSMGLKSSPTFETRMEIINSLVEQFGIETLLEVPGFYVSEKGRLSLNLFEGNILIPARNTEGLITGIQINNYQNKEYSKYVWLSSASKGGAKTLSSLNFFAGNGKTIGITEGAYKACTASSKLGIPFISIPGVTLWGAAGLVEAVQGLSEIKNVQIFLDMDYKTNEAVKTARDTMAAKFFELGYSVELADWNSEFKGIDDVLLNTHSDEMFHVPFTITQYKELYKGMPVSNFINQQYLSPELIGVAKVQAFRSPKGSGKTQMVREYTKSDASLSVLSISHLKVLSNDQATRMNLSSYLDLREGNSLDKEAYNNATRLTTCLNSIINLDHIRNFDVLFIDEINQILKTLATSETLKTIRTQVTTNLIALIKRAKKVIVADADLSFLSYIFLAGVVGEDNIDLNVNLYKNTNKPNMNIINTSVEFDAILLKELENGENIFVPCSSKVESEAKFKMLNEIYPGQIMLINSDNSSLPETRKFMSNLNENIKNYRVLVGSPSLFSGVDISQEHFNVTMLHVDQTFMSHTELLQGLERNRAAKKVYVFMSYQPKKTEPTTYDYWRNEALEKNAITEILINFSWGDDGRRVIDNAAFLELYALVKVEEKLSTNNLSENFFKAAQEEGYSLIENGISLDKGTIKEIQKVQKKVRKEVREENIFNILNAPRLTSSSYNLLAQRNKTKEEKAAAYKYELESFYNTDLTREMIEREGSQMSFTRKLETFMIYKGYVNPIELDTESRQDNNFSITEESHNTAKNYLIKFSLQYIDLDGFSKADLEAEFKKFVRTNEDKFYRFLNIVVRKDFETNPVQLVSNILDKIGLKLVSNKQGSKGNQTTVYSLNKKILEEQELLSQTVLNKGTAELLLAA